jgi:transcription antitermination factor NusG
VVIVTHNSEAVEYSEKIEQMTRHDNYKWHVVYTKNQHEKRVYKDIIKCDIYSYLPLIKETREWSDRKKEIECPLFPNYLFVKTCAKDYIKILENPSVIGFVKTENRPATIPDNQIQTIKTIVSERMEFHTNKTTFKIGNVVEVVTGPLKGIKGEIVTIDNQRFIQINLRKINKNIVVKIEKEKIANI